MSTTAQPKGRLKLHRLSFGLLSILSRVGLGESFCWSTSEMLECKGGERNEAEDGGGWKAYGEFKFEVEVLLVGAALPDLRCPLITIRQTRTKVSSTSCCDKSLNNVRARSKRPSRGTERHSSQYAMVSTTKTRTAHLLDDLPQYSIPHLKSASLTCYTERK